MNAKAARTRRVRRELKQRVERPICAFSGRQLGISEPKVLISELGAKIYVGEDIFFRQFVGPAHRYLEGKFAPDRRQAARVIPGLAPHKGARNVEWQLNYRTFIQKAETGVLVIFMPQLHDENSPLFQRICDSGKRTRLTKTG